MITDCTPGPLTVAPHTTPSCTLGTTTSGASNYVITICSDAQLQPPTASASCSPGTAGDNTRTICSYPLGANNQTTVGVPQPCTNNDGSLSPFVHVTCTFPAGVNNQTSYPDFCGVGTTTDGSNVTSDCSQPGPTNYSNTQVATCTANTLANNQKITCSGVMTSFGPQIVDATTCPSSVAVGNVFRTCTTVAVGAYPAWSAAPSCATDNGSTGTFTVVECNYPAASNYTNKPISQASTCTTSSPIPGNNYLSVTCDTLPGPNNTTVFVPPATCATDPGTSGSFIKVDCGGPTQTMAPHVVDPTTCTPVGDTTGPAVGGYVVTRCQKIPVSYQQSDTCVAGNTGDPDWIQTDCVNSDTPAYSPPCTEGTTGTAGNSVTCTRVVNIVNQPIAGSSCTSQPANAGDNYLYIDCNTTTTFGPQVVDPSTCTVPTSTASTSPFATTTCVTAPFGTYATPQFVDPPCVGSMDGAFTVTQCTKGPNYNPTPTATSSCTNGAVTAVGPASDHTYATCIATDVTDYVYAGTCSGSSTTGSLVTCQANIQVQADATVPSCSDGSQSIILGKQTTTNCSAATTSLPVNAPSCVSHVSGTDFVTCGQNIVSGPITDPSCIESAQVGSGTITHCTPGSGSGYKLRVTTTTTTTTTQMSGTTAVTAPSVITSTGAPVELTACLATTDPLVALPAINPHEPGPTESPSPPGGCGAWPCITSTTVPSGSQNSLADVAQYYYKTDLRPTS